MIASIFTGIVAIAKAVPVIKQTIDAFIKYYVSQKIAESDNIHNVKAQQLDAQLKAIQKAESNEERKALSITLDGLINQ